MTKQAYDTIPSPAGSDPQKVFKELPRRLAVGFLDQLRHRELAGAVDGNAEIGFALFGPDLGNVDVKEADRIALELLPLAPLRDRLGGDAQLPAQLRDQSLRLSTDWQPQIVCQPMDRCIAALTACVPYRQIAQQSPAG